jgi:hypothetical protein
MPNRILLTGLIIFGVVAIIIALNYYYNYHPIRSFYTPPPTSGKLDKFGIKEIYLSKRGGEERYINSYDPKMTGGGGISDISQNSLMALTKLRKVAPVISLFSTRSF